MRSIIGLLLAIALGTAATAGAQAPSKKFQCWTDENGRRACGDRVPPQFAQKERQVFDGEGRVIEVKERPKTAEELAAAEQAKKAEADRKRAEVEQRNYDRFLMSTFNSIKDLEKTRDQRLAAVDGRLQLTEKSVADNEAALKQLRDQAADAEKEQKKVPKRITRQIAEFEATLKDNSQALAKLRSERAEIDSKFATDIERLKTLRAAAGMSVN